MGVQVRYIGTSAQNTAQTVSAPRNPGVQLLVNYVTVAYSAAPTQTGVTIVLNSASGASYDTTLYTGTANTQYTFYLLDGPLSLESTDTLDVTAPSAGGTITSSIAIVCEVF